jgi:hypothetical protein
MSVLSLGTNTGAAGKGGIASLIYTVRSWPALPQRHR